MDEELKEQPKSKFPTWMRGVALLVVAVFLPEQAAWAMSYDPSVLWAPKYYLGTGQAGYMANFVAENVRRSLNSLEDKPLGQIQISQNLVVNVPGAGKEATYLSSSYIKKIYSRSKTEVKCKIARILTAIFCINYCHLLVKIIPVSLGPYCLNTYIPNSRSIVNFYNSYIYILAV